MDSHNIMRKASRLNGRVVVMLDQQIEVLTKKPIMRDMPKGDWSLVC